MVRPTELGEQRAASIRRYLQKCFRSSTLEKLQEKSERYAMQIGVTPTGRPVRNFRSRWGSCDQYGRLSFNWNITKPPHSIIDYIVVHELCHILHPNHSKTFWREVSNLDADCKAYRQWLKERYSELIENQND